MGEQAVYRDEDMAIECARRILASWMHDGVNPETDVPLEAMPTPLQATTGHAIRVAREQGRKGWRECVESCVDQRMPHEVRAEMVTSSEALYERPQVLGMAVETVLAYAKQLAVRRATWELQKAIDAGEETAPLIGQLTEINARETTLDGTNDGGFEVVGADELEGIGETRDFVEGLLIDGGFTVVYGPSNCGKSFWVLDLAAHVASQPTWRHGEVEIENGVVIYVALEGSVGVQNRIQALIQRGILTRPDRLLICYERVSLMEPGHAGRMAKTISRVAEKAGEPVRMVVLDTWARATAGGDENSGQDMGVAIANVDAIRRATESQIVAVHHCGKDEAKGARGHSSLRAASDTEIEIFRPSGDTISTVRVTKQRDLPIGEPMPFSLETVVLGIDKKGREIKSCVVRHEDPIMAHKKGQVGRKKSYFPEQILRFLPAASTSAWQKKVAEEAGIPKTVFYRLMEQAKGKQAHQDADGHWVRNEVPKSQSVPK